jgi:hypothetical protein
MMIGVGPELTGTGHKGLIEIDKGIPGSAML